MNALLALVRLRINRMDTTARWAVVIAHAVAADQASMAGIGDRHTRPAAAHTSRLDEQVRLLLDGSREYSLRKHPVPPNVSA